MTGNCLTFFFSFEGGVHLCVFWFNISEHRLQNCIILLLELRRLLCSHCSIFLDSLDPVATFSLHLLNFHALKQTQMTELIDLQSISKWLLKYSSTPLPTFHMSWTPEQALKLCKSGETIFKSDYRLGTRRVFWKWNIKSNCYLVLLLLEWV